MRGVNDETKRKLIKVFLTTQKADMVCIQETKWKACSKGIIRSLASSSSWIRLLLALREPQEGL